MAILDSSKLQQASDYDSSLSDNTLDGKFDETIRNLEEEREKFYNKTKGLFKRALFRTAFVCASSFVLIGGHINDWVFTVPSIVGPIMMSLVIGLIGGGIYSLVRKGTNNHKFSRILKRDLVSKIVTHVNPQLSYFDEGIEKEEFDKADLFVGGKKSTLRSEDKISGTVDGKRVCISECMKKGPAASTRGRTEIKIKGKTIATDRAHLETNIGEYVTYFDGLFIEIELDGFDFSTPLKFIPNSKIRKEVETGIDFVGHVQKFIRIDKEDKIDIPGDHSFEVYCNDRTKAESAIDDQLLKVADYIFGKYNKEGEKILKDIPLVGKLPIFKDVKTSKSVFLSIVGGKLYLALEWPEDMFETDVFLKNNLIEGGIAQKIYEDLLFINQLIKEVNLMNKISI